MKELSIVIPVFNSQDCLERLYGELKQSLSIPHEVILVNDQSSDGSWAVIRDLVDQYENIIGINLRMNKGQDNAIMAGLSRASGKFIVVMDDDLQHPPSAINKMYEQCKNGYDVCYGNYSLKKQNFWKNIGSWWNGKVAEFMLNKPIPLYLSPFKIMKASIADAVKHYHGPYPYLDGLILSTTNNITQVEVEHNKRFAGKSNYSLFKSLVVWGNHVTGFSVAPLRFVTACGLIAAIVGFLLGLYYIFLHLRTNRVVEGWTTLVVINLFSSGIVMMALGIIGEYVGRSYLLLNHKPQYNIKEVITNESKVH